MNIKILFHSFVDIITNSSTVIYTYQSGCISAVKELINEILKLSGESKTADELFYIGAFCDVGVYTDHEDSPLSEIEGYKEQNKAADDLIQSILTGEIEQPEWMTNAENSGGDDYNPDMSLHIVPQDEGYRPLADKLLAFINSSDHEACRDG